MVSCACTRLESQMSFGFTSLSWRALSADFGNSILNLLSAVGNTATGDSTTPWFTMLLQQIEPGNGPEEKLLPSSSKHIARSHDSCVQWREDRERCNSMKEEENACRRQQKGRQASSCEKERVKLELDRPYTKYRRNQIYSKSTMLSLYSA